MAVNYDATTKTDRMTAVRDRVADGTLELLDNGTVISSHDLSASGGSVAAGVWTLAFANDTVAAVASVGDGVDSAQIKDSGGTVRISGLTVATSGTDVIVDNTSINSGQNVTISSATITHAT